MSQKFYKSKPNDLSNMYRPSIITCLTVYFKQISSSIGSLSAWSNEGNFIGKDLACFNSSNFSLNRFRSNVNGAPRLLVPSSSRSFLYRWNPSIGMMILSGNDCLSLSEMVDFPAPGIPQTPIKYFFSDWILWMIYSIVRYLLWVLSLI